MLTWAAERPFCEHLCGWRMGGWFPAETPFGSHCSRAFWSWPFCEFLYPKLLDTAAPSFQTKAKRLIGSSHPTQGNPLLPQGTLRRCDYAVIHPQVHPQGQHPQKAESRPQDASRQGQLFQPPVCHGGTCFMGDLTTVSKGTVSNCRHLSGA